MRSIIALVGVLALAGLAGCVGENQANGTDRLPSAGDPLDTNATLPGFGVEGCIGNLAIAEIPETWTKDHVPEAFETTGLIVPGASALDLLLLECDQIVNGTDSAGPKHVAIVSIDVVPQNRSWEWGGLGAYVIQFVTDDERLAMNLTDRGMTVSQAKFTVDHVRTPAAFRSDWLIEADAFTWRLSDAGLPGQAGGGDYELDRWYGQDPYERLEVVESFRGTAFGGLGNAPLVMAGESPLGEVLQNSPSFPMLTNSLSTYDATFRFGTAFEWRG